MSAKVSRPGSRFNRPASCCTALGRPSAGAFVFAKNLDTAETLHSISGPWILSGLVGVTLLFYFGMPFHVPTDGFNYIHDSNMNTAALALEARYMVYGYIGLGCLVVGTILQMVPLLIP